MACAQIIYYNGVGRGNLSFNTLDLVLFVTFFFVVR